MDNVNRFAAALRRAMADAQIGVGELAAELGVSRQSVSAWRSGRSIPDLQRIGDLERALRLSPGQLLHEFSAAPAEGTAAQPAPAGYDARIANLPDHVRRTIDDIIDTYEVGAT